MSAEPKRVAIVQSNYIPWKGYFDLIAAVDEFVLYDDVQFTRRDWRNRNRIKTPQGVAWLTVPVKVRGRYHQSIRETELADALWGAEHWAILTHNYRRSPCFAEVASVFAPLFLEGRHATLSALNRALLQAVSRFLGISTRITDSQDYELAGDKTDRLVSVCDQAGATVYVSGPSAKSYLVEERFQEKGVVVEWFDYSHYPEYPQLWGSFVHEVTIMDLLFNCGYEAPRYRRFGMPGGAAHPRSRTT